MIKLRITLLACLAGATLCQAAPTQAPAEAPLGPARVARKTPATVAAARAAAEARANPAPVAVELPALSVQQIAERNATARGGLQAWQRVASMSMSGKLDAGQSRPDGGQLAVVSKLERAKAKAELRKAVQEGKPLASAQQSIQLPFQLELKRPTLTRLEIPFQGETAVQVFDGVNGWKLRPYLGRHEVEAFSPDELRAAAAQQELDGPLLNYAAKGTRVSVQGGEMVNGRAAYKLELALKSGELRHLWVDAQTFLDLKIDAEPRRVDGKLRNVVTYMRDYRPVDGLLVAHQLETTVEGLPGAHRIYIEKVALNPSLQPSRFARPL